MSPLGKGVCERWLPLALVALLTYSAWSHFHMPRLTRPFVPTYSDAQREIFIAECQPIDEAIPSGHRDEHGVFLIPEGTFVIHKSICSFGDDEIRGSGVQRSIIKFEVPE